MKTLVEQILPTKNPEIFMLILQAKTEETEESLDVINFEPAFVRGELASKIQGALDAGKAVSFNGKVA